MNNSEVQTESASPGKPGTADESRWRTVFVSIGLGAVGILFPLLVVFIAAGILILARAPFTATVIGGLVLLQFLLFVVVGVGYLASRGFDGDDIVRYLGVDLPSVRDIGLILLTWIVMFIAMIVVAILITMIVPELVGVEETEPAENPATGAIEEHPEFILIAIVGMFLVVGPAEEILFRGVIQNRLRERLSAIPAIILASAIFAVAHTVALVGQDPVAIAMTIGILFVPSIGFGAIYEYTGNIVVPSLLHGFHNSVVLLAVYAAATADPASVVVPLMGIIG